MAISVPAVVVNIRPELRSTVRFLLRMLWLFLLQKTFGDTLSFSSQTAAAVGFSTTNDVDDAGDFVASRAHSSSSRNPRSLLLLDENTASLWLAVYSCLYFSIGLGAITVVFWICTTLGRHVFANNNDKFGDSNINRSKKAPASPAPPSTDAATSPVFVCRFGSATTFPGFELLPRIHPLSIVTNIVADVAVISFISPRALIVIWPAIELAVSNISCVFVQISQHLSVSTSSRGNTEINNVGDDHDDNDNKNNNYSSNGNSKSGGRRSGFSSRYLLMRALQSQSTVASVFLLGLGITFGLLVTISEHGLFQAQASTSENHPSPSSSSSFGFSKSGSNGLWMFVHSVLFLTVLRTMWVNCVVAEDFVQVFSFARRQQPQKQQRSNANTSPSVVAPGVHEYLQFGATASDSLFILLRAVARSAVIGFCFAFVSKFLRLTGSTTDSIADVVWFVTTELVGLNDDPAFAKILHIVFWILMIFIVALGRATRWSNLLNNDKSSSLRSTVKLFWTFIASCAEPFAHSCLPYYNNNLRSSSTPHNVRSRTTSPSPSLASNIHQLLQNQVVIPSSTSSPTTTTVARNSMDSNNNNKNRHTTTLVPTSSPTFLGVAVALQSGFSLLLPYLFAPSVDADHHVLLVFLWTLLAVPLFVALNHVFSKSSFYVDPGYQILLRQQYECSSSSSSSSAPTSAVVATSAGMHDIPSATAEGEDREFVDQLNEIYRNSSFFREENTSNKKLNSSDVDDGDDGDEDAGNENPTTTTVTSTAGSPSFVQVSKQILFNIWSTPHERKLFIFFCCTALFMLVELVVGTRNHSLSLVSDAFHMMVDSSSILVGLVASYASKWKPTKRHPFGFAKYEALSGMLNGILLLVVCAHILHEAYHRLENYREQNLLLPSHTSSASAYRHHGDIHHHHVHHHHVHHHHPSYEQDHHTNAIAGAEVLPVGIAGLVLNIVGVVFFHDQHETYHEGCDCHEDDDNGKNPKPCQHHHQHPEQKNQQQQQSPVPVLSAHDANMRGVFLHILADLLGSIAVVISTIIITYNPTWYLVDTICAMIVSCLILIASSSLLSSTWMALV